MIHEAPAVLFPSKSTCDVKIETKLENVWFSIGFRAIGTSMSVCKRKNNYLGAKKKVTWIGELNSCSYEVIYVPVTNFLDKGMGELN